MQVDDLPWPELGNVSRGATRGNQGQKGALGPPDADGRCVLQLRVQPGVLSVKLNRKSSEWYRTLDSEVNRALKLTKTYWRKARRRQDYDARADQDHMELHEWLQQLKDKTMSHLEVLMQKGDIQGPPYVMPDDIELSFLRKFIERHNAGIPHNPRLRHLGPGAAPIPPPEESMDMSMAELSDGGTGYSSALVGQVARFQPESISSVSSPKYNNQSPATSNRAHLLRTMTSSPATATYEQLVQEAQTSGQFLQESRAALGRAQVQTQEAFQRYTACLEVENRARREVANAESHRDEIMAALISRAQTTGQTSSQVYSRQPSLPHDDPSAASVPPEYHHMAERRPSGDEMMVPTQHTHTPKPPEWRASDLTSAYGAAGLDMQQQSEMRSSRDPGPTTTTTTTNTHTYNSQERKHSRSWEQPPQPHPGAAGQVDVGSFQDDLSILPPRKRPHHMVDRIDVLGSAAHHHHHHPHHPHHHATPLMSLP